MVQVHPLQFSWEVSELGSYVELKPLMARIVTGTSHIRMDTELHRNRFGVRFINEATRYGIPIHHNILYYVA